ncbi:hypothetical protein [Marinirhabdus gelatinilytica]|uniref:Uncharacterized protein n=1 Tax=Marinirhabdus gelatinilytica TaxID=1703343 RepID=A0A370QLC8_9FLAO|nr:hypothetical protein [Marinirhabdus gelatinilytica]RDK89168.1 hypothetical protein C8D94_1011049 [Marinirhabdus gelatinilytica]
MEIELPFKIDAHRRLCIKKDLIALSHWMDAITAINTEIDYLKIIEQQLIKEYDVEVTLQALRRKNTLLLAMLCKYEQELNTEYEYGKREYNVSRAKEHEKKRDTHIAFIQEFTQFKKGIYHKLSKYQRR